MREPVLLSVPLWAGALRIARETRDSVESPLARCAGPIWLKLISQGNLLQVGGQNVFAGPITFLTP
jgi:hypothetical protein